MAKPKKIPTSRAGGGDVAGQVETPALKWKVIAQIAAGFAILWVTALMIVPYVGYWGVGVVGALTVIAIGFGVYVWRLTRKSAAIAKILKTTTDEQGRRAALEKLELSGDAKDAMNALARAQLAAQDDPAKAMEILEGIDLKLAPAVVQDDVRANLALLYLVHGRTKEARPLCDEIRFDRQPNAKAKAMYAAVVAETFARTGKIDEARKLLETYSADDAAYGEVRGLLLRAQVYTFHAQKKSGLAKKAMQRIAELEVNMLGSFANRKAHPELQKMVQEVLRDAGYATRPKMQVRMR